ncbi:MAG: desulfoferrodoxin [archaeon]
MAEENSIYKCETCGIIVEVIHGGRSMACCGSAMKLLEPKTTTEGVEKHKPIIELTSSGYKVKIGSIPHPMLAEHHIEWVELILDDLVLRKNFVVGALPEWEFCFNGIAKNVSARAYCNIHGLWKSD